MSKGLLILAEDDPTLRHAYGGALKKRGYNVFAVSNGREVLDLLPRVQPRLIVLDINMPDMDGIEACRRARPMVDDNVPILFLTGSDGAAGKLRECMAAGGTDFLIKTDEVASVLARIDFWAGRSGSPEVSRRRADRIDAIEARAVGSGTRAPAPGVASLGGTAAAETERLAATLLARAREVADQVVFENDAQRCRFVGYAAGMLDAAFADDFAAKPRYETALLGLIEAAQLAGDPAIQKLLAAWPATTRDFRFVNGAEAGRCDWQDFIRNPAHVPLRLGARATSAA